MKKILAAICVLTLIFSRMPSAFAAGTVTLMVGDATVDAGGGSQSVTVPISVSGNSGGVCGICVTLSYDDHLKLTGLEQGETLQSLTYTAPEDLSKNPATLLWDGIEAEAGDGIILYATFTVPDKAGDYRISIDAPEGSIYDNDLEDYTVKVNGGTIHVEGDSTNSGGSGSSGEDNGNSTNWGKDNPSNPSDSSDPSEEPTTAPLACAYYVVLTMTDEGKTEECRVAYHPYGATTDTVIERKIDLGNISNVMVKLLEHIEESTPEGERVICYVVTTKNGRVNVEESNRLNQIEE